MAAPLQFERVDTGKRALSDIQDRLEDYFQQLDSCPLLVGHLVKDVAITSGTPVEVRHLLGRTPEGWLVVRQSATGSVFESGPYDSDRITLDASGNMTISVWVF